MPSPLHTRNRLLAAVRHGLYGAVASVALLTVPPAEAQSASTTTTSRHYELPAGPLDDSLRFLARETQISLSYQPGLVAGKQAPALVGEYAPEEALQALLAGSGLSYRGQPGDGMTLVAEDAYTLAPMTVVGDGEDDGYRTIATTSATRLPVASEELPQTVNVVPGASLRDRGASGFKSALAYTPGVTSSTGEGIRDQFIIRGFSAIADTYVDGMRDGGLYFRDTFNLERVEVVKGPTGVLYGRGSAGGLVNSVSKRASFEPSAEVSASLGSYDHRRVTADLNTPLTGDLAVRINAMSAESDSFRSDVWSEKRGLAIAAAYRPTPDALLDLEFLHTTDERVLDAGIPGLDGAPADVPISTYYGAADPGEDDIGTSENNAFTADLEVYLSDEARLRNTFRLRQLDLDRRQTTIDRLVLSTPEPTLELSRSNFESRQTDYANKLDLYLSKRWLGIEHELTLGSEIAFRERDAVTRGGTLPDEFDIRVFDPDLNDVPEKGARIRRNAIYDTTTYGLYVNDHLRFNDEWSAMLGVRHDWLSREFDDREPEGRDVERRDNLVSPRAGIVYRPNDSSAYYISASRSYQPGGGTGVLAPGDEVNPPERATNIEIGSKFSFNDDKATVSISLFHLVKENVPTRDRSIDNSPTLYIGEVTSRGIELSASGDFSHGISLHGGITALDAEVTESNNTTAPRITPRMERTPLEGKRLENTPRLSARLWGTLDLDHSWRTGLGVRYQSETYADTGTNAIELPSYTVIDAGIFYDEGPWSASLNLDNVLDREYYSSATNDLGITPGTPRTLRLTTRYAF